MRFTLPGGRNPRKPAPHRQRVEDVIFVVWILVVLVICLLLGKL